MHAHSIHTYWTEIGNGAAPNASWDKVASGTVVIQRSRPGRGVHGDRPRHQRQLHERRCVAADPRDGVRRGRDDAQGGSITTGDFTRLAVSDDSRMSVGAGVTSGSYWTDWYGSCFPRPPAAQPDAHLRGRLHDRARRRSTSGTGRRRRGAGEHRHGEHDRRREDRGRRRRPPPTSGRRVRCASACSAARTRAAATRAAAT